MCGLMHATWGPTAPFGGPGRAPKIVLSSCADLCTRRGGPRRHLVALGAPQKLFYPHVRTYARDVGAHGAIWWPWARPKICSILMCGLMHATWGPTAPFGGPGRAQKFVLS